MAFKIWGPPTTVDSPETFSMKRWFEQAWQYIRKTFHVNTDGQVLIAPTNNGSSSQLVADTDTINAELEIRQGNSTTTAKNKIRLKGGNNASYYYMDIAEEFYDTSAGNMRWLFNVNSFGGRGGASTAQTALQIDGSGLVTLPYGKLQFPSSPLTSSDANTLDAYVEGTWTPAFTATGDLPVLTYTTQTGYYTRIGRVVYYTFVLVVSGVVSQGTGTIRVTNFPYVCDNNTAARGALNVMYSEGFSTTAAPKTGLMVANLASADLYTVDSADARNNNKTLISSPGYWAAGQALIGGGFYFTST